MKVKMLVRNPDNYIRETKRDIHKVPRNYDPNLHPFEIPREYVKAMNAVKLDKVFAKPFIGNLDGHKDGVSCFGKHPQSLSTFASGAYDGEVRLWNLSNRSCIRTFQAHDGYVRGISFLPDGEHFLTIGDDKTIKLWETVHSGEEIEPSDTVFSKTVISAISHHRYEPLFATCGEICQIWEETRSEPIKTFKWGVDSLHDVAYNPIEGNILGTFVLISRSAVFPLILEHTAKIVDKLPYSGTCASDRSIMLYDSRETGPVRKLIMKLKINKMCWNPMESFIFSCASEDYNVYTFDMRKLSSPVNVHMDHVEAVTHIDYSPTGKEFVTGSYDKSVRIFEVHKSHSRDIYHTKRMQRLGCVAWSLDNKYVMSGSDEMNIRIWKARASEKLGVLKPREKAARNYSQALKDKFSSHPQVSRIARHRQVPKHIYHAKSQLREARDKIKRKEANRRKHSRPGSVPYIAERERHTVGEQE